MRCSTLVFMLCGVLLYLCLGAVVFRTLEVPREEGQHMQLHDTRRAFLENYTCVSPDILQALIEVRSPGLTCGILWSPWLPMQRHTIHGLCTYTSTIHTHNIMRGHTQEGRRFTVSEPPNTCVFLFSLSGGGRCDWCRRGSQRQ